MKGKTKKKLQRLTLYFLVGIFVLGTILLYLPVGQQSATPTPAPLNDGNLQNVPAQTQPQGQGQVPAQDQAPVVPVPGQ